MFATGCLSLDGDGWWRLLGLMGGRQKKNLAVSTETLTLDRGKELTQLHHPSIFYLFVIAYRQKQENV